VSLWLQCINAVRRTTAEALSPAYFYAEPKASAVTEIIAPVRGPETLCAYRASDRMQCCSAAASLVVHLLADVGIANRVDYAAVAMQF